MTHETDGETCWCGPRVVQPCPECPDEAPAPGCWRCGGEGLAEPDDAGAVLVIHNDAGDILRQLAGDA